MFPLGHAGPAVAFAARRGADPRWAALMALGPDLLDKPVAVLMPSLVSHNTRNFGHTALIAGTVLFGLLAARVRGARLLWGCWVAHLLLDRMWSGDNPAIFLWPLRGDFPKPVPDGFTDTHFTPWYLGGELVGGFLLLAFMRKHRLFSRARLASFLRTGRIP